LASKPKTTEQTTAKAIEHADSLGGFTQVDNPNHTFVLSGLWAFILLAGVLYGSLIPFDIDLSRFNSANGYGVFALTWRSTTLEDVVTNVLIYMPIGVALILRQPQNRRRLTAVAAATVVGTLVSMLAETLQTGIAIRVASLTDVLLNSFGTAIGAGMGLIIGRWGRTSLGLVQSHLRNRPLSTLGGVLAISLFAYHLAPFDFVTDSASLHRSFARADWSFASASSLGAVAQVAAAVWFFVLGYFLAFGKRETGHRAIEAAVLAVRDGVIVVGTIELMQLFTSSHVFEALDIVLRSVAVVGGGVAAIFLIDVPTGSRWRRRPGSALPTLILAALVGCQIVAMTVGSLSTGGNLEQHAGLGRVQWLPFEILWRGSMTTAAVQAATSVLRYGALALTIAVCLRRARWAYPCVLAGLAATLVVFASEAIQVVNPQRVPDLTAPVLALVSAVVVVRAYLAVRPAAYLTEVRS